jgi:CDP-4-dehydro-6-deoxyglucose reductase
MQDFPDMTGHQVYACGAPIVVDSARRDFVAQCHLPDDAFLLIRLPRKPIWPH